MALTKTVVVRLEVQEAPDFFPEVVPTVLSVVKGVVAEYLCSFVANSAFTGRVRLSVADLPAGAVESWDVTEIGVGEIATLTIQTADVAPGTTDFAITFEEV